MGDYRVNSYGGVWKECPECGALFFVPDVESWAYKRYVSENGQTHMTYFCIWSCLRTFEARYDAAKKKRKSEGAKRGHEKRKKGA